MNFIIENNKFDKKWYKIEAYTVPESDEIRTKLGACLFHIEDNQIAIYQLLLLGDKNDEFYNKIELFARSLYVKSISIGLFELLDLDKIFFLKSHGFTEVERFYDKTTESNIIHFKKSLTYETIWDGVLCKEDFCTYADAIVAIPDGYRLPTLEEAELFCKLYGVSYKDKELRLKSNDGTILTAKVNDNNSYGYVTYPYQMHIWVDSELITYFKKGICCHNFKTPVIESRSIYLKGCALYVKKEKNEVQEQN